jgi:O-succinylbenzoic acid--CoA ligase
MNSSQVFLNWLSSKTSGAFVASSHTLPSQFLNEPWLWMATSGTTSAQAHPTRWIAHTRESLFSSAKAVCEWLDVRPTDRWGRVLPRTHMGGLSLDVRSAISKCEVLEGPVSWSATEFSNWAASYGITLVSMVPTQIFDLCQANLKPPPSLRAVIVGAARLDAQIMTRARELGWPILTTYGLTETASMICSEVPASPSLQGGLLPLSHVQLRLDESQRLEVRSSSLFCAELVWNQNQFDLRRREEEWWKTSDRARLVEDRFFIEGRVDDFVKIYGTLVHLPSLDEKLTAFLREKEISYPAAFVCFDDARAGARLEIAVAGPTDPSLLSAWNAYCLGNERASRIQSVPHLPRTELGKLRRALLKDDLGTTSSSLKKS